MGILGTILEMKSLSSGLSNPEPWLLEFLYGGKTKSSAVVTESTALNCIAVYACIRVISEDLASLPLFVYERMDADGKKKAREHPLYEILHTQPNPEMSSFTFRETLEGHLLSWGNGYAEIEWAKGGYVKGLWPLRPDKCVPYRNRKTKKIWYRIDVPAGPQVELPAESILHIRGLGFDGLVGYSPIRLMREGIGMALATEEFGGRFFSNSANPGGVLEHPGKMSDTAYDRVKKAWEEKHQGLEASHRIAILEEGMKWQALGIPPEDAQFLQTRKFQLNEIARGYRMPPHKIGDMEKATFSNIEQQAIDYVVSTLRPWLVRWEQECNIKLLSPTERQQFFTSFLVDGLLRGDTESRYKAYAVGRQWGWLSADDIRSLENQNPLPDEQGKKYMIPLNMQDAAMLDNDDDDQDGQGNRTRLFRATSTAGFASRKQMALAYHKIFKDMANRIIRREEADVMRQANKMLPKLDVDGFLRWLEEFYKDHPEFIRKVAEPAFASYTEVISGLAGDEIGVNFSNTAEIEVFMQGYMDVWVSKHIFSSLGQLRKVLEKALVGDKADVIAALQKRFDEWKEKRVGMIADSQVIRANNAVAKQVWRLEGVPKVRWMRQDEIPFCKKLHRKVVGIDEFFIRKGEVFQADGKKLTVRSDIGHPPLIAGCKCFLSPVVG